MTLAALPMQSRPGGTSTTGPDVRIGKHLIFRLASEDFAIPVMSVQEILGLQEITPIPQTDAFIKGVINLRGRVIPVLDLRLKLALNPLPYTERTCIIVVRRKVGAVELWTGVIVDEVLEVVNFSPQDIQDTPDFGTRISETYLRGVARTDHRVRILLDIDKVLAAPPVVSSDGGAGLSLRLESGR